MLSRSGKCLCRERHLTMSCGMRGFPAGRQWYTPATHLHDSCRRRLIVKCTVE